MSTAVVIVDSETAVLVSGWKRAWSSKKTTLTLRWALILIPDELDNAIYRCKY